MELSAQFLLTIGFILALGLLLSSVARRTFLPRVTLLLLLGMLIGQHGLDLVPLLFTRHFDLLADMTLLMVGFLLGGKLTSEVIMEARKALLPISLLAALLTTFAVSIGMFLSGVNAELSIVLGSIAAATAPAAVFDVTQEFGREGRFSRLLLSVVAIDDVWALMMFAIALALAISVNGGGAEGLWLTSFLREIVGALLLGVFLGWPFAMLTGRVKPGQPMLSEAVAVVFICGGLALWLEVSYLLASIVMGSVIANKAKHHDYPFHSIQGIESIFMVIFFVLAGASLDFSALGQIGVAGVAYILLRMMGKYTGAYLGGLIGKVEPSTRNWMGVALWPQAGVAIGMALVASSVFPEYRQYLLSLVISTTVFFELIGPMATRLALSRTQPDGGA